MDLIDADERLFAPSEPRGRIVVHLVVVTVCAGGVQRHNHKGVSHVESLARQMLQYFPYLVWRARLIGVRPSRSSMRRFVFSRGIKLN